MSITLGSRAERNPEVIFTDLDDIVVMMDAEEGRYYELDAIGARIWALLEDPRGVAEVCEVLAGEYDVEAETCRRDVLAFLAEAEALGIVRVAVPAAPEGPPAGSPAGGGGRPSGR